MRDFLDRFVAIVREVILAIVYLGLMAVLYVVAAKLLSSIGRAW